jgi:hypothetical protein
LYNGWKTVGVSTGSSLDDVENRRIFKTLKRQWNILITESWLDDMEDSRIFKTMKIQWDILITGSWYENCGIFKTMKRQWNILIRLDELLYAKRDMTNSFLLFDFQELQLQNTKKRRNNKLTWIQYTCQTFCR